MLFCRLLWQVQGEHVPSSKAVLCVQVQVRLQRPTVVAEIGFMLSVTKFFVPGVAMSGVTPTPFESNDVTLEGKPANPGVSEPTHYCLQPTLPICPVSNQQGFGYILPGHLHC